VKFVVHKFEQPSDEFLFDKQLSLKAKGLLSFFMKTGTQDRDKLVFLTKESDDGESSVRSGWSELLMKNYVHLFRFRAKKGFAGSVYLVFNSKVEREQAESIFFSEYEEAKPSKAM